MIPDGCPPAWMLWAIEQEGPGVIDHRPLLTIQPEAPDDSWALEASEDAIRLRMVGDEEQRLW